jgi:hypothetical protein
MGNNRVHPAMSHCWFWFVVRNYWISWHHADNRLEASQESKASREVTSEARVIFGSRQLAPQDES